MSRHLFFIFTLCLPAILWADPAAEINRLAPPALRDTYATRQFAPLWLDGDKPSTRATQALELMNQAEFDGLQASDYALPALQQSLTTLQQQSGSDTQLAAFDLAMSGALTHYASDLYLGRADPRQMGMAIDTNTKRAALPQHLQTVLNATDLTGALATLRPTIPPYTDLRRLLVKYRTLATQHPSAPVLPPLPSKKLVANSTWDGTPALTNWLITLGYLPANTTATTQYDDAVVEGVKRFQQQHGQIPDGVIGKQTYANLLVSLPQRVQQIELAMERLRWIDDSVLQKRFLLINIPQFTLWAYAPDANQQPKAVLQMPVVVGKALRHQTPAMTKTLSALVFNPYWNVPRSIATKELLPQLYDNPFYLARQGMELVDGSGRSIGSEVGEAEYNAILNGGARIRQRPGSQNALGSLKFVFPNDDAIYMHDTPSKSFFAKERRDLSHGCVRLGNPMALALFVLQSQNGGWDEERIRNKLANSHDQHLSLGEKLPVLLLYFTATADDKGEAIFLQDIYQRDNKLAALITAHRAH